MGLFDRFRKRVHEVADETDDKALSVEATSEEAQALLDGPASSAAAPQSGQPWRSSRWQRLRHQLRHRCQLLPMMPPMPAR